MDKYGRKISRTHEEDSLERFYRLAEDGEDDIKTRDIQGMTKPIDYARGEVLLESSDEEGGQGAEDTEESSQSDADEILRLGGSDEELDIDLDEDIFTELDAQVSMYAKVNESLEEKEEKQDIGVANRTRRLAVVNLDWEYVRASHLYKIFSCLVSPTAPHVPVTTSKNVERPNPKKGLHPSQEVLSFLSGYIHLNLERHGWPKRNARDPQQRSSRRRERIRRKSMKRQCMNSGTGMSTTTMLCGGTS